jgi:aspartyl-tRNA(Asn)/glutamyl-tRNA(Gln) amidotransferase subunit A
LTAEILKNLTIDEVRNAVAAGQTTATALAEMHYDRIAVEDKEIHSYLSLSRERALTQAARIDAMAQRGDLLPPLAGVPVGIKDVLVM